MQIQTAIEHKSEHTLSLNEKEWETLKQLFARLFQLTYDEESNFGLTQDEFVLLDPIEQMD